MIEMRCCVSCGRSIDWSASVCPYCGHDYRAQVHRTSCQSDETLSSGMRAVFYVVSLLIPIAGIVIGAIYCSKPEPQLKRVGKMCLILALAGVLLTVAMSALLYVMVLSFGEHTTVTPTATLSKTSTAYGYLLRFGPISSDAYWDDVTILLSDGSETCHWSPSSSYLAGGSLDKQVVGEMSLGALTVYCNVTDLAGNGYVNMGDFFTLTTSSASPFSNATTYVVKLMYDPTGSEICHLFFTG